MVFQKGHCPDHPFLERISAVLQDRAELFCPFIILTEKFPGTGVRYQFCLQPFRFRVDLSLEAGKTGRFIVHQRKAGAFPAEEAGTEAGLLIDLPESPGKKIAGIAKAVRAVFFLQTAFRVLVNERTSPVRLIQKPQKMALPMSTHGQQP